MFSNRKHVFGMLFCLTKLSSYKYSLKELLARANDLIKKRAALYDDSQFDQMYPLWGIPFIVKDILDVKGLPTTAGSVDFPNFVGQPVATKTATIIQRCLDAGAILIGKANLDMFATGLVGTRSQFGLVRNPYDQKYIAGGSSSGSAVAVALGWASFSFGTDTAGSNRVPAAFNNIVGYKPTPGLIPTTGTFPAVRSIDAVGIFSINCTDAQYVANLIKGYNPNHTQICPEVDQFSTMNCNSIENSPSSCVKINLTERGQTAPLTDYFSNPKSSTVSLSFAPQSQFSSNYSNHLTTTLDEEHQELSTKYNAPFRVGIPKQWFMNGTPEGQCYMPFFGDKGAQELYKKAIQRLIAIGGTIVQFDYSPWATIARMLYGGAWVAERYITYGAYIDEKGFPNQPISPTYPCDKSISNQQIGSGTYPPVDPATFKIISPAKEIKATRAFLDQYRFHANKQIIEEDWKKIDVILLPTTGTIYSISEVMAGYEETPPNPSANIRLNNNLGWYTNFANLLNTSAIAVPAGFRKKGDSNPLPFGVTMFANTFNDGLLFEICKRYEIELSQEKNTKNGC
ncbi:allophanate hydrolase (plasmid) [Bacillus thuringiensis]|uniref:Allophanate hydrolase n=1 Tax=Bacillus thuringiensis TaxID=1428 RepID=A0A9W3SIJ7_BACTU|nr:amidase family protein [Bacillus thuringiensis]ANS51836.1 allophanate hydrolase [Bacillus thuringiensis]